VTKNRFSKALKHIKKDLNEVAPTNSMSGVYSLNDPGYSLRHPSAPRTFLPDIDGNFPSGIPGTPGTPYIRPAGIWTGDKDWDEVVQANFGRDQQGTDGNSTAGLIAENGVVYTALPPNSRSYILGPLVDGFVHNHGSDAYTRIGYIQKDTRQFVLLAYIRGTWKEGFVQETGAYSSSYNYPVWDGTTVNAVSGFHTYGSFTLADAQWMRAEILAGRYMKNVSYRSSGGIGQSLGGVPGLPGNFYNGAGVGGGSGDAAVAGSGGGGGYGKGGDPTIGDQQTDPPKSGDAKDAGFPWFPFGKLGKKAKELWDNITDGLGDIKDNMEEFFNDAFDDAVEGAKDFRDSLQNALDSARDAISNVEDTTWAKLGGSMVRSIMDPITYAGDIVFKGLPSGTPYDAGFKGAGPKWAGGKKITDMLGGFLGKDVQYFTPDLDTAIKYAGEGGNVVAMPRPKDGVRGFKNWFGSNVSRGFDPTKGVEQIVKTSDSVAAKNLTKVINLSDEGAEATLKALAKKGATNNKVLSKLGKAVPFLNAGLVAADVTNRISKGDYAGALLGGLQIIPGPVGWIALGSQVAYDVSGSKKNIPWNKPVSEAVDDSSISDNMGAALIEMGLPKDKKDFIKEMGFYLMLQGQVDPNLQSMLLKALQGEELSSEQKKWMDKNFQPMIDAVANRNSDDVKESYGLRKVKFVINEIASAPTTPTNQTTTQQPTESKETADALAKEYIEKNGPEKTQELINQTDEYLSAHGAGEEPSPHTQSDVDRETMQQEVESEIDNNDELDPTKKHDNKAALAQAHRINAQIDANWNIEKEIGQVKDDNNLKIALSIASNRIITHHYPPNLIDQFIDTIDSHAFTGGNFNLIMPIVSSELGYADDNIYIENGIIKDNTSDTHQQIHHAALTNEQWFKQVGEGMSQLVIPSDGGVPYIIFKDYNYHNLRSQDPHEIPGGGEPGAWNWWKETSIKIMSGGAHSIGFLTDLLGSFGTSLINPPKSIGPGWPEGIHGATYTEFKRNLDQLPVNIQNMIMSHPLYWTDGRYGELFADEQATEDEFVRSYKAISSLPNGKNLATNLQDKVWNKPEFSEFRSLWDTYESEWEDRETNEKEIEKLKRELYYDFNSKYWGGYTDQDPDSPTFNQWIETPEKHFKFHDLSRQEQFELVGVSYPDFVEAEKALGLTSDGEVANWRQMLDGEQGLTGLAGKTVEAGDKLREIEKEFFAEFPESRNGGIFRTNDKAEAARWTEMYNKHQSAMTAYMKAWDEWDAAAGPVYDTLNSVNDKYYQEYKPNEEDEYAKKKDEFEKQIEKLQNDWEIRQNELYGQMEPFYNQMFQEQIKLFHSTFFDKKFGSKGLSSESWEPGSAEPSAYEYDKYEPKQGASFGGIGGTGDAATAADLAGERRRRRRSRGASVVPEVYKPKGRRLQESDLNLSRRQVRMLKEIKKPVSSFELLPQKLSKYKPNFKGKYSPQNTPDKTASKESDALVMSGNQKGQAWRTQDKYWSGYETQERMNVIMDRVGHGNLAWQMIVDEAREKNGWKNREIQEHLNIIAAEKGMREQVPDYESPFGYVIHEQGASTEEELDTVMKDPLVKKVAKRLRTQIDYKDKPSRKGFPDEPPAKQQDGWHPEYGKKYKYDKLDPQSAEAMPPTGNPEIDANVEKAKPKKPRWKHINTESKVDPKVKVKENLSSWRTDLSA